MRVAQRLQLNHELCRIRYPGMMVQKIMPSPKRWALGSLVLLLIAPMLVGFLDQGQVAPSEAGLSTVFLADGTQESGELLQLYDQSTWWNPTPETTYALFQGSGFGPYPDDESVLILSTPDVVSVSLSNPPTAPYRYRSLLRAQGITIGSPPLAGRSFVITGNESYHLQEDGFGDFAWDFGKTDDLGQRFVGLGELNDDYFAWDEAVFLPTGGTVVEVVRDRPDNTPGSFEEGSISNLVGIHLGGFYYLYLLHFRQGSIPINVQLGATLPKGSFLGTVGNSGVSLEPHLHVVLLWLDTVNAVPRLWSVPSEFIDVYSKQSLADVALFSDYLVPQSTTWISSTRF